MPKEDQELPRLNGQTLRVVPHNGEETSYNVIFIVENINALTRFNNGLLLFSDYSINASYISD